MLALRFHRTARGSSPVEDHIESLGVAERTHVLAALADIQEAGIAGSGVTTRQIEGKLWEIKVSAQRVFYVVVTGPTMVLLHAYKKQGQKAPRKEIDTARRRMKEALDE